MNNLKKQIKLSIPELPLKIEAFIGQNGVEEIKLNRGECIALLHFENDHIEKAKAFEKWLLNYVKGVKKQPLPPHQLAKMAPLTRRVLSKLLEIPYGETLSYSKLADQLNIPGASRAVGSACGKNPLVLLYPCHRVLRQDGSLGGFGFGLEVKKILLEHEQLA